MIKREMYKNLWADLSHDKPMIFISGPRQSGKTTFTMEIAKKFSNFVYFNWDIITDKKNL